MKRLGQASSEFPNESEISLIKIKTSSWGASIRGPPALRAAIIGAFFDEVSDLNGKWIARILWDMENSEIASVYTN